VVELDDAVHLRGRQSERVADVGAHTRRHRAALGLHATQDLDEAERVPAVLVEDPVDLGDFEGGGHRSLSPWKTGAPEGGSASRSPLPVK